MQSKSFAPLVSEDSKVLILGTMPGIKSLEEQQYYAHERNAFWPIMFSLFNEEPSDIFNKKVDLLRRNKIALWDTLKLCYREGSLDSNIKNAQPNEIEALLKQHKNIKNIIFNGQAAEKYYKKYQPQISRIAYYCLPSTSPANARLKFEDKLDAWKIIKGLL